MRVIRISLSRSSMINTRACSRDWCAGTRNKKINTGPKWRELLAWKSKVQKRRNQLSLKLKMLQSRFLTKIRAKIWNSWSLLLQEEESKRWRFRVETKIAKSKWFKEAAINWSLEIMNSRCLFKSIRLLSKSTQKLSLRASWSYLQLTITCIKCMIVAHACLSRRIQLTSQVYGKFWKTL